LFIYRTSQLLEVTAHRLGTITRRAVSGRPCPGEALMLHSAHVRYPRFRVSVLWFRV